jgi:hypothetical protein
MDEQIEVEEEEIVVARERRLVGRKPWEYPSLEGVSELQPDTGFGEAGAKLDPSSGALKYDKFEDIELKRKIRRERMREPEPQRGIEFSADSHAMIHIKEDEDVRISPNGDLIAHDARGIVSVRNLSDTDRLWDIDVNLHEESGVALVDFENIFATELEPKTKVSKDYRISERAPSIMLHEAISTHPDYPESLILKKDKSTKIKFEVGVKNVASVPYRGVVLNKTLPEKLSNVTIAEGPEDATTKDGKLQWRVNTLGPGEVRMLRYEGEIEPTTEDISIGEVVIQATGEDTISKFVFTAYNAMCRNMYFIEADETDEPGVWLCRFICDNTSTFEVEILKVQVRDSASNQMYLNLTMPKLRVPPNQTWESEPWMVEGKDRPSFIKTLVLNVIPGLSTEMNYKLTKDAGVFQVGSLEFTKTFDKNKAIAGRITDLAGKLVIENVGTAPLEHIVVRDLFPTFLATPSNIRVERSSIPLNENVNFTMSPEGAGPTENKVLSVFINDLSQYGGALTRGEKIVITYNTQVFKPTPKSQIVADAEVDGRPLMPGPVVSAQDVGKVPTIGILQILRKFSIGKSIEQGAEVGEYNIGILYKNRGNQPIKDLVIKDILPRNFTGAEYTIDPQAEATVDQGTILTWNIPLLDQGETTRILYKIKGEGEYHPSDAQIFYNYTPE